MYKVERHLYAVPEIREPEQEALPGMEILEIIEGMSYAERVRYRQQMLEEISDRESLVHAINRVNEAEGVE